MIFISTHTQTQTLPLGYIRPILICVSYKEGMGCREEEGREREKKNAYQTTFMCSCALVGGGGEEGGRGRLAVLGRGERSKCIAEGEEEEEGLQLLFMSSREQRAHLGPYVNPQQASAH